MDENFALKDMFNRNSVGLLADAVHKVSPTFPRNDFINGVFDSNWENLALKERVRHITLQLGELLPQEYRGHYSP